MIDFSTYKPLSFTSCESPYIVNIKGKPQLCRCGKCACCRQARRNVTSVRLASELNNWKHAIFFTLTYDRYHVPSIKHYRDDCGFIRFESVGRSSSLLTSIPYRPELSYPKCVDCLNFSGRTIYSSLGYIPQLTNSIEPHTFGVLCYRDVQLFKKRFSQNLLRYVKRHYPFEFKKGTPRFCFFVVGEYGTRFYRPHFHLVFMFDSPFLCPDLNIFRDIAYDSWSVRTRLSGYGRNKYKVEHFASRDRFTTEKETRKNPNFSFVRSSSSVSSYVSSYVCSSNTLPKVLAFRPWQPRTISPRGKYGTFGTSKDECKEIVQKVNSAAHGKTDGLPLGLYFKRVVQQVDPTTKQIKLAYVPYSNSAIRSCFCKPVGYSSLVGIQFKSALALFSHEVTEVFRELSDDPRFPYGSLLDFVNSRDFKSQMIYRCDYFTNWIFDRPVDSQRQFLYQQCLFGDDLYDFSVGIDCENTWLFFRNALRTMLTFDINLDDYWICFDYLWNHLIPQCRLYDFYYEQQLFRCNNISSQSLLQFYDVLPIVEDESLASWYSTLGVHYPSPLSSPLVKDLFYEYVSSCGDYIVSSMRSRFDQIIFNHFKHKSRSDF